MGHSVSLGAVLWAGAAIATLLGLAVVVVGDFGTLPRPGRRRTIVRGGFGQTAVALHAGAGG